MSGPFINFNCFFSEQIYEEFDCTVLWSTGERDVILLTETFSNIVSRGQWRHDSSWKSSLQKICDFATLEFIRYDGSVNVVDLNTTQLSLIYQSRINLARL